MRPDRVLEHLAGHLQQKQPAFGQGTVTVITAGQGYHARAGQLETIRCGNCNRKLAEGDYLRLTIKCPRCGALNALRAQSPTPERHRASLNKDMTDGSSKQDQAL